MQDGEREEHRDGGPAGQVGQSQPCEGHCVVPRPSEVQCLGVSLIEEN